MIDPIRKRLMDVLGEIDRPGSFCVSGEAPVVVPGLEVEGLGPIGLPLTQTQAKDLIKCCQQAPYGKGEKTVVDRSVRRVWKLGPDQFSLTNPEWDQLLATIVGKVQEGLGLEKQKLESHLYDLLLYEPGGFFLPHRDGEKLDGMVATLVIVLPSQYEGGALVVRHEGREETIDFRGSGRNPFLIHFAAFYADCEHEVRPLEKGYRLCLVYNLTLAKSKSKQTIRAPRKTEHLAQVTHQLEEWSTHSQMEKLVITLDHQYTEAGLSWDALKGVDRIKAEIIKEAAEQAGCRAYLALLTFHESGSAEYVGTSRWRRRYDDDESDDPTDYEMEEVFESSLTARPATGADARPLPVKVLRVLESEILDPDALRGINPETEFEGYTGNAGMTLERWYRHASIIVWPARRHFETLCNGDGKNAVPELERMVTQASKLKSKAADAHKVQCLELAGTILANWSERTHRPYSSRTSETDIPELLQTLAKLGDQELIGRYLRETLPLDVTLDPAKSVATLCEQHGWATFESDLQAALNATTHESLERNVRLLEPICSSKSRKKTGWRELCQNLATTLVMALKRIDRERSGNHWQRRSVDRAEVLASLTRSLLLTEQTDLLSKLLSHALATPKQYPLISTQVAAITRLRPWLKKALKSPNAALTTWLASCREQLESLTARPPEPPKDFRRAAKFDCSCVDCTELKQFMANPKESVHRFRVKQERRNHVANTIRNSQCDVDCVTDKQGSPQSLVCTKNQASFLKKAKEYQQNLEHLSLVGSIEAECSP